MSDEFNYYVRFKHITPDLMFTSSHLISTDHIQIAAKLDANEWDIQVAVCKELENLNYLPEHIRIESFEQI